MDYELLVTANFDQTYPTKHRYGVSQRRPPMVINAGVHEVLSASDSETAPIAGAWLLETIHASDLNSAINSFTIVETVSVSDHPTSTYVSAASNVSSIIASDSSDRSFATSGTTIESASASSIQATIIHGVAAITESVTASNVTSVSANRVATVSESVSSSDVSSIVFIATGDAYEPLSANSTATVLRTSAKLVSESVTIIDDCNGIILSTTTAVIESLNPSVENVGTYVTTSSITESGSAASSTSCTYVTSSAVSESVSASDATSNTFIGVVQTQETGNIGESSSSLIVGVLATTESLTASDVTTSTTLAVNTVTESVTSNEQSSNIVSFSAAASETLSASTSQDRVIVTSASITNPLTAADTSVGLTTTNVDITETISLIDISSGTATVSLSTITESVSTSETSSVAVGTYAGVVIDSGSATDSSSATEITEVINSAQLHHTAPGFSATTQDATYDTTTTISETLSSSDASVAGFGYDDIVSESLSADEVSTSDRGTPVAVTESLTVADTSDVLLDAAVANTSAITALDVADAIMDTHVVITESGSSTDTSNTINGIFFIAITESGSASDTVDNATWEVLNSAQLHHTAPGFGATTQDATLDGVGSVSETSFVDESSSVILIGAVHGAETISASDSCEGGYTVSVIETEYADEASFALSINNVSVTESVTAADTTSRSADIIATISETRFIDDATFAILANDAIEIHTGTLQSSGISVALSHGVPIAPDEGQITIDGIAPNTMFGTNRITGTGSLVLTSSIFSTNIGISTNSGTLSITGYAPEFGASIAIMPQVGDLTAVGQISILVFDNNLITPASGGMTITGLSIILNKSIITSSGTLTIAEIAPLLTVPVDVTITPATGELAAGPGDGDRYFANVISLLHFNGSNAGTSITDVTGKSWTANGDAQLSTSQQKFGATSLALDGTGDYVDTPDSADWNEATQDFTYECFFRTNALAGVAKYIFGQSTSNASQQAVVLHINASNKLYAYCYDGVVTFGDCIASGTTLLPNTWYHAAYVRNGVDFYLWIDGVLAASASSSNVVSDVSAKFSIGRLGEYLAGVHFDGFIDEFRVTNGIARYTNTFTPPTHEFSDFSNVSTLIIA